MVAGSPNVSNRLSAVTQETSSKLPKVSRDLKAEGQLLREEARRRARVGVGIADPAGVELDPAVVEVAVRGVGELAIGPRAELVACTVHV